VGAQQNKTVEPFVDDLWFSKKKANFKAILMFWLKLERSRAFADLGVCRQGLRFGVGLLTSVFTQITVTPPNWEQSFDPS
jgi:hypothetical protein